MGSKKDKQADKPKTIGETVKDQETKKDEKSDKENHDKKKPDEEKISDPPGTPFDAEWLYAMTTLSIYVHPATVNQLRNLFINYCHNKKIEKEPARRLTETLMGALEKEESMTVISDFCKKVIDTIQ